MTKMRWLAIALFFASPAAAVTCEDVDYQDNSYSVCHVDATTETLRLFHSDDAGDVLGSFGAVDATLGDEKLAFAMNAGMYHADRAPVGHYVEDGIEKWGSLRPQARVTLAYCQMGCFASAMAKRRFLRR